MTNIGRGNAFKFQSNEIKNFQVKEIYRKIDRAIRAAEADPHGGRVLLDLDIAKAVREVLSESLSAD